MGKRQREDHAEESPQKKPRKGFSVGPENLPDGTYRRKTQKIKNDLIQKAKVKKAYARIKAQEKSQDDDGPRYDPYAHTEDGEHPPDTDKKDVLEIHPARQAMLNEPEVQDEIRNKGRTQSRGRLAKRQPGNSRHWQDQDGVTNSNNIQLGRREKRYKKEFAQAKDREATFEAKQRRREIEEKDRRAMIKAKKPGKDGRQKLGRQGNVLLSRVKRMMDERKLQ